MSADSPNVRPSDVVPLDQPLYGATMVQAISRFFRKYATFTGRASRSEFWWTYLAYILAGMAISGLLSVTGIAKVSLTDGGDVVYAPGYWIVWSIGLVVSLALTVPFLAICWRRLHDSDRPGPFFLFLFIPLAGPIILLVFLALPSRPSGARYDRPA
ncbi:DUF805 domain-containing protein [Agromyces sp. SYSU T00266]|uniref:DUF805 domain-containing protein n=1 Tax=Agromyces zhanjiangensis TaxID=3158562 RepID=UPI003391ADB0